MDKRKEIEQELNELAPKLGGMEKKNPFKAPDYYFQSLPDRVIERAKQNPAWTERIEHGLNDLFNRLFQPRYAIPFAVSLVILAVGVGLLKSGTSPSTDFSQQLSQIPTNEINDYILENFEDDDLIIITASARKSDFRITKDIPSEELDTYIDNNIDNQTMEEDLL